MARERSKEPTQATVEMSLENNMINKASWASLVGSVVKKPPAGAEDTGSIPGPGRSHMLWGKKAWLPQLLEPECLEPTLRN